MRDFMKKNLKKKVVIVGLFLLTGLFVFTTADVQKEITQMFLGGVASFSLLTIIFFISGMLKSENWKNKLLPYVTAFGMLIIWMMIFTILRLFMNF